MGPTLQPLEMSKVILDNDSIIRSSSLEEETSLILTNDVLKMGFNPIGNDLSDNLVWGIAETNGPKVHKGCSIFTLRNQAQVGRVCPSIHRIGGEYAGTKVKEEGHQGVPVFLIHERMESIRTRSLKWLERKHV